MPCTQSVKTRKYLLVVAGFLLLLLLATLVNAQGDSEKSPDEKARQEMLKRKAVNAFRRLKRSMDKDGFYSGRVALNVWRSTAIDAGTFDQTKYDEIKAQLYHKSVDDSLRCFEEYLLEEDFYNANFCLQTWRMHAKELGIYDQAQYEAFKQELADARTARAARRAKEK